MKRIGEAAAARLATRSAGDEPITAEEMVRLLSRIARTGPPAARLGAVGLLDDRMRLFQETPSAVPPALSDEERAQRIEAILGRARQRRAIAQRQGGGVAVPQENH